VRFSIVTPTSNSERFLAQTIESVISQKGDFEIHYVIVDNLSTDRTAEIAARYESLLKQKEVGLHSRKVSLEFVSERDRGMYEAINRGFAQCCGDVMAWINSDDIYLPGAFAAVSRALLEQPGVAWLKGVTSYIDEKSEIHQAGMCNLYDQRWTAYSGNHRSGTGSVAVTRASDFAGTTISGENSRVSNRFIPFHATSAASGGGRHNSARTWAATGAKRAVRTVFPVSTRSVFLRDV
jgi:glycosyltransferase involved in cell wall biosynthesis